MSCDEVLMLIERLPLAEKELHTILSINTQLQEQVTHSSNERIRESSELQKLSRSASEWRSKYQSALIELNQL